MSATIYNWCMAPNGCEYGGATDEDEDKIEWYAGFDSSAPLPPIEKWTAPMLTRYSGAGEKAQRSVHDCVHSASLNFISERAAEALRGVWDRHANLYPVKLDDVVDKRFFMVVVKTELDCIDRKRSTGPLQKYGETPEYYAYPEQWVFDEQCVGDADLFVIPDSKTNIFVSDRFRGLLVKAGLKGFCLREEFWEEHPWVS